MAHSDRLAAFHMIFTFPQGGPTVIHGTIDHQSQTVGICFGSTTPEQLAQVVGFLESFAEQAGAALFGGGGDDDDVDGH